MIRILFCVLFSSFIISKDLPNDVRWVTSSKEYKFSCHQTFNTASIMLDNYLKKRMHFHFLPIHRYSHNRLYHQI